MKNDRTGTIVGNGLRAAARTDCGRQRDDNEDRYFVDLAAGIFLVIDGVGGHAAGEVAARIAHETILKRLERPDAAADVRVREAITLANQQILLQAKESPARKGMACVLTLALLEGRRLTVGHVGDTRLYRLSPDGIAKMTHDHSPVGEREDAREISETEAMQHARRNEVYRDVGSEPREPDAADFIEIVVTTVEDDAALLLCSDGLSDMLPSLEINRIVREHAGDPSRVVDALVDAANDAGGKDNITVVYVEAPRFAASKARPRGGPVARQPAQQVATEALAPLAPHTEVMDAPDNRGTPLLRSRALAMIAGALLGLAVAFGLAGMRMPASWPWAPAASPAPREISVGGADPAAVATIGEALLQARDGDVIRVHPGRYEETLDLRRRVTLISAVPHQAVLAAPAGPKAWASVTVWAEGTELRGFRISNEAGSGRVGVRVHTGGIEIDDARFDGALEVGVDAVGAGSRAMVRASQFDVSGIAVQAGDGSVVTLRQNVFRAAPGAKGPAVSAVSAGSLSLDANLFVHFPGSPIVVATGPPVIVDPAYVVPPPARPRGRR
jgi:PPM family protein phosphatase